MKNNLKKMMAAGGMMMFALSPLAAFATDLNVNAGLGFYGGRGGSDPDEDAKMMASSKSDATFCDFIADKSVEDFKRLDMRAGMMDDKRDARDGAIAGIRAKFDDKRDGNQADRDMKFNELATKWEAMAKTDAEKAAIVQFKAEFAAAIADRNGTVATTVAGARDGRDALRAESRAKIDAALATLQANISAALIKAKASCDNGTSSATVRATFAADVKAAVDAFKTSTATIRADAKADAGVIHDERKSDMQDARNGFKSFFQSLRERFQALFGIHAKVKTEAMVQ